MKNAVIYTVETDDKILCFYRPNRGNGAVNAGAFLTKKDVHALDVSYFDTELKAENARDRVISDINFMLSDDCKWFNTDESKCHDEYDLECLKLYKAVQKKPSIIEVICRTLKIE